MGHLSKQKLRVGLVMTVASLALTACNGGMDWDLRQGGVLNTTGAARSATESRPQPDSRGVISYPGYQVAVAQRGDTVASVAGRLAIDAGALARYNALQPQDPLRPGEVLALPTRVAGGTAPLSGTTVAGSGPVLTGNTIGSPPASGTGASPVNVTTIATTAIDRASPQGTAPAPVAAGQQPAQHKVARGETAFTIARQYNVSAKALAEWNGLGPDMGVREGQMLMIPVASAAPPKPVAAETAPGQGSPTPLPPSASDPLPDEDVTAASEKPKDTPTSPDLASERTGASASKFAMPVGGSIIRGFGPPKSLGIDISANAGASVAAADSGTVAAVTKDTDGTAIVIIRHADNVLTVYGGVDQITVKKGDKLARGAAFAKVRGAAQPFLHFEVRKGMDAVDPMAYLQ
ncbi:LysM peptidoglycan-binding domain-containing protein [Neogemmobacter tilapiae]